MKKTSDIILSYILSKALFFGMGISNILFNAKQNSYLAIILGYLIGFIILLFLSKKRLDILPKKLFGKILLILLILITFINSLVSFTIQTSNFYLPNTPTLVVAISFLIIIFYGSSKGFETYKRFNELLVFIGIILSLIGVIGNIPNIELTNFKPFLYGIDITFIRSVLITIVLSLSPIIILLTVYSNIDRKKLLLGYTLGGIHTLILLVTTIGTLGITLATTYIFPEYIAFEKISAFEFIERIENILAIVWLIDMISVTILCQLSLSKCLPGKISYILSIIITLLSIFFIITIFQNSSFSYQIMFNLLGIIILLISIVSKRLILKESI